jgi:mono/diheme cytochrome c family protein
LVRFAYSNTTISPNNPRGTTMGKSNRLLLCFGVILALTTPLSAQKRATQPLSLPKVDYGRDVRPILAASCFPCHGPDEKKRQAGLRLDERAGALSRRPNGTTSLVPGKPDQSNLLKRVIATAPLQMPPPGGGKRLTAPQIAILRRWIAQGGNYAQHWSFQKVRRPSYVPHIPDHHWTKHDIDAFIFHKAQEIGLRPNPMADRYTLIRRLSLDLTGLPPTPQEVDAFVKDKSANAYEKQVDRLLSSSHFGEKWARMWLDLARYADSAGYGSDPLRLNIWPWRDWVIQALNTNKPFDRFTIEQLAGDLLPKPTQDQIVATAFHRNTMTNTEGGTDDEEFRIAAVKDRAITTAQTWMGLTMGCAQCHTHKFDPITQKEFYGFMAFFNQTEDYDQPDERPTLPLMSAENQKRTDSLKAELEELKAKSATKEQIAAKEKEIAAIPIVRLPILRELPPDKQRKTNVLVLANFLQKGEEVTCGTPVAFPPMPKNLPKNRLGVAQWLVSRENPLTARVAVNRFWSHLFGRGLVETEEDFGLQGAYPTHPELLDWLAAEFMEKGWNVKGFLKMLVMTETYRQSSKVTPLHLQKDPRNLLLMRYPRRRLDAETVRDQALALSGLLSQKIGGPSVFPPQPAGMWQAAFNGERTWSTSTGEDRYRRGIYTFWRRTVPYPSMATFDAPSRETSCIRRIPTNTPLQALVTMNDPVYLELAQALARRVVREGGTSAREKAQFALRLVIGRPPSEKQTQTVLTLLNSEQTRYSADLENAIKMATEPLGALSSDMNVAELAAWTVVANTLLNLDGVLTNG